MTEAQLHNWYEETKKQQESHEEEHQKRPPTPRQPAFGLLLGKNHRLPRGNQEPVAIETFLLDFGFQFFLETAVEDEFVDDLQHRPTGETAKQRREEFDEPQHVRCLPAMI